MKHQTIYRALRRKITQITLGFVFVLLVFIMQHHEVPFLTTPLNDLNGLIYDGLVKLNMHALPQRVKVVVIDIDDVSIQQEGRWPWPRNKLAILLDNLKKAGALVVALDIVMSEPEINYAQGLIERLPEILGPNSDITKKILPLLNDIAPQFDNDTDFASVLKKNEVVLGYLFQHDPAIKVGLIAPPLLNKKSELIDTSDLLVHQFTGYNGSLEQFFNASPDSGFVTSIPDQDGILRHGLLVAGFNQHLYAGLALATVMRYLIDDSIELVTYQHEKKQWLRGIKVGGIFIPTNRVGQVLIPFYGPPGTMDYYSASDVMSGRLQDNELAGAIAVVGSTMVLLADLHPSPASDVFPGVEMNANIISGILSQQLDDIFHWHTWPGILLFIGLGLLMNFLFAFLGPISLIIIYLLLLSLGWIIELLMFVYYYRYIDLTAIFFIGTLLAILHFVASFQLERRQKNKIRSLFAQYVAPDYVKQLTEFPELYNMDGEERNMTVFFADIRNFTTLSEPLSATEVKLFLNTVFTPMTEIIFAHHGTIDKYVGDMVVAFWGAPIDDNQHATHAIETALVIQNNLRQINQQLKDKKLPSVKIGMGLSTGLMNVGDMGSAFRRSYTVLGDVVNVGSRLQELTKFYQVNILVGERTRSHQDDFIWQYIDKVSVKGRHEVLSIYEPLGYYKDATALIHEELKAYEQALASYFKQDWLQAKALFDALVTCYPSKYLYQLYATRIVDLMSHPTELNWDGSYIHTHK